MSAPKVRVFFYGSFINKDVLAASGFVPGNVETARVWGFDIRIAPLANLVRSDRHCVYGIVCETTHAELDRLYGQDWVACYLPEAVIAETAGGGLVPALCYIAPSPAAAPAASGYIDRIVTPAREHGFPEWYIDRIESYRPREGGE